MERTHTERYFLFKSDTFESEFYYIVCIQNVSPANANLLIVFSSTTYIYMEVHRQFYLLLGVSQISTATKTTRPTILP